MDETSSPGRDHHSPKTKILRLDEDASRAYWLSSSARLGEPFLPDRGNASPKIRFGRLSEMLEQHQGELLLFSPRRDELAWERIPALSHYFTHAAPNTAKYNPYSSLKIDTSIFKSLYAYNRSRNIPHTSRHKKRDPTSLTLS